MKIQVKSLTCLQRLGITGPALSTGGNLDRARARGAGPPRTVKHRYLPVLGRDKTLMMRAKK